MKRILIIAALLLAALPGSAQKLYKASNFGIKSDGVHNNTSSIQGAVDFLSARGLGDTLEFSVGRYVTGAVQLKSGVCIKLREGAVIVGSTNIFNYKGQKGIFWAQGAKNISIFGDGVFDGRGPELLDNLDSNLEKGYVPNDIAVPTLLYFKDCTGVSLKKFILRNPATAPDLYIIEGGDVKVEGCYSDTL